MNRRDLTLPLDLVRTHLVSCQLRATDDDDEYAGDESIGVMDVRFSPFNTWYRIDSWWEGSFLERTVPGAFKRTIAAHNKAQRVDAHRIRCQYNHGMDMYVHEKLLGNVVEATEDADSPRIAVRLWNTSYNRDLLPGLKSGEYGSSFAFRVIKEEWNEEPGPSDHNPDGIPERTMKEVRVFEAGPVTWPASPTASAGMRCIGGTDQYMEHLERRDPSRVAELRNRLTALRAHRGPAPALPADSPARHSEGMTPRARRHALFPFLVPGVHHGRTGP